MTKKGGKVWPAYIVLWMKIEKFPNTEGNAKSSTLLITAAIHLSLRVATQLEIKGNIVKFTKVNNYVFN